LSTRVLPLTVDLVTLTISQGYADNLHDIESNVANFIANKRGASVAKVVTAIELDDKTQKALQKAIKNKVGTDVELSVDVDPSVIGGISISVGERTFDGLLSSKFSEIKTVLEGR
jgi:F-type H+-transporting ATPase subunit delta